MHIPQECNNSDYMRKTLNYTCKRIIIRSCGILSIGIFPEEAIVNFSRQHRMTAKLLPVQVICIQNSLRK